MKKLWEKCLSLLLVTVLAAGLFLYLPVPGTEAAITLGQLGNSIEKLNKITKEQALQVVDIVETVIEQAGTDWLGSSEINNLKELGLTKAEVMYALGAISGAINSSDWDDIRGGDIIAINDLYNEVKTRLGNDTIQVLTDKGIDVDDLILAALDVSALQITSWDNIPEADIVEIFDNYAQNAGISQQTAAQHGLNWNNVDLILGSLSSTQKDQLKTILVALGNWLTGPSGGPGGTTTPTTPATPVQTEEQNQQVNDNVVKQVSEVIKNITAMNAQAAVSTITNAIQTIIQTQATVTTETKAAVTQAVAAAVTKAATVAETAVSAQVQGNTAAVSVDATAVTRKIAEVTSVVANLAAKMTEAKMEDVAQTIEKKVVIEAPAATQQAKQVAVSVPGGAVSQLKEAGVALEVKTPDVTFNIPAASLPAASQNAVVQVSATKLTAEEAREALSQAPAAGGVQVNAVQVVELNVKTTGPTSGDSNLQTTPDQKIRVAIKADPQNIKDPEVVGVYRYNEQTRQWDYMGGRYDASTNVVTFGTDHTSLYAIMEYKKTFADIQSHWAKRQVEVLAGKHIVKGMTENNFEPEQKVTRAQFAALIAKMLELKEAPDAAARFSDVAANAWYSGVVGAVAKAGIISGYGAGTFGPNDLITREQAAVMITNALKYNKSPVTIDDKKVSAQLASFGDNAQISSWAQKGVALLTQEGIIAGYGGKFAPAGQATRAEAAAMLYKTLKKL